MEKDDCLNVKGLGKKVGQRDGLNRKSGRDESSQIAGERRRVA